jgi:hypothetical protein
MKSLTGWIELTHASSKALSYSHHFTIEIVLRITLYKYVFIINTITKSILRNIVTYF